MACGHEWVCMVILRQMYACTHACLLYRYACIWTCTQFWKLGPRFDTSQQRTRVCASAVGDKGSAPPDDELLAGSPLSLLQDGSFEPLSKHAPQGSPSASGPGRLGPHPKLVSVYNIYIYIYPPPWGAKRPGAPLRLAGIPGKGPKGPKG